MVQKFNKPLLCCMCSVCGEVLQILCTPIMVYQKVLNKMWQGMMCTYVLLTNCKIFVSIMVGFTSSLASIQVNQYVFLGFQNCDKISMHQKLQWMQWKEDNLSLRKVNKFWHILSTSLSNHLNEKTRSKKQGPQHVLTNQKDEALVAQILGMQKCRL